jgi:hypothetical protein
VEVVRDDPGQCNRVIQKYKLIGKFTLLDIAHQALEIIRRENVSISYVGLTSLSLYQRMHTHDAAHFPDKGRSIFWICTARSDIMRVVEGKLVQILRQHNICLQNSYSSSLSGAGVNAQKVGVMIDLYLLSDSFTGNCSCHFCTRWSIRIDGLKRKRMDDELHAEGHYYWLERPLDETHAAGEVPANTKYLRSDNCHRDHHEDAGFHVASEQTIDSHRREHEASTLARRIVQDQKVENDINKSAKQDNVKDNDAWMNILFDNFEGEDDDEDIMEVQPTEIDESTSD